MWRFYQTGEKTEWIPIQEGEDVEVRARAAWAIKLTILAVSELPDKETGNIEKARYRGPMYFDIDFPEDQRQAAIQSAQELAIKLVDKGVPKGALDIRCSGNKGFHLIVPETAFRQGRALSNLPHIYREMALELFVDGMDMGIYRAGRGCCWRLTNIRRPGNRYCVPITYEELMTLTPEKYEEFTSGPRNLPKPVAITTPIPALTVLFQEAKQRTRYSEGKAATVTAEELEPFVESPPQCIHDLSEGKRLEGVNFNDLALQVATFIVRAGLDYKQAENIIESVATSQKSNKYQSAPERIRHLRGLVNYVKASEKYQFSCQAMRGLLSDNPCEGCVLNRPETGGGASSTAIYEREGGYWCRMPGNIKDKRLTTFTLMIIDQFQAPHLPGQVPNILAYTMDITARGVSQGVHFFDNEIWTSRSSFIKCFNRFPHCMFYGNDNHVQELKQYLDETTEEPGVVMEVYACGIHQDTYEGEPFWVYVEPGHSINSGHIADTHYLQKGILAPSKIKEVPLPNPHSKRADERQAAEAVMEALEPLLRINSPETIGVLLGWFVAAHFRPHCMENYREFPLLNIWGASGTGKSTTMELLMWLSGCDKESIGQTVEAPSTTRFAITSYLASSTSIVRPVEEYNKSKMPRDLYRQVGDLFKASFNGNVATRGVLGRGSQTTSDLNAQVMSLPINAPIVYLSEQTTTVPAIAGRSIQVQMTPGGLTIGRTAHAEAVKHREKLRSLAKLLIYGALDYTIEEIRELVEAQSEFVPEAMGDRPQLGYKIVLAGLEFIKRMLEQQGLTDLSPVLNEIKQSVCGYIRHQVVNIVRSKMRSEVDDVLEDMALMAHLSEQAHGGAEWLTNGRHFHADGEYLYLDVRAAHAIYRRFKRHGADGVVIESTDQFVKLLHHEPYFVNNYVRCARIPTSRPLTCLSVKELLGKGVDVTLFPGVMP